MSPVNGPLYAMREGKVTYAGSNKGGYDGLGSFGNFIRIEVPVNGEKLTFVYAHLNEVKVKVGDVIAPGQLIGLTGKTGNANEDQIIPHVHIEVQKPNGTKIDPTPFFTTTPKHQTNQ